jgi:hypothetical protein
MCGKCWKIPSTKDAPVNAEGLCAECSCCSTCHFLLEEVRKPNDDGVVEVDYHCGNRCHEDDDEDSD